MSDDTPIQQLLTIITRLRDPATGCPWDVKQDFDSIGAYTIEEAYEVVDAIDRRDFDHLKDELGDLLLQIVFQSELAREQQRFDFNDVVGAIVDKMIRRHPHVFADADVRTVEDQTRLWDQQKREEQGNTADPSALADIGTGMPEWQRALKLQKRAATVGFDWPGPAPVIAKLREEIIEVEAEFATGDAERLADEIGDVLFVCVNLARHAKVDFSRALRLANAKFERRFRHMEMMAGESGRQLSELDLTAQDALWNQAKLAESAEPSSLGAEQSGF